MSKIPEHLTDEEVDDWIERETQRQANAVVEEMKKDSNWNRIQKLKEAKNIMTSLANQLEDEGFSDTKIENISLEIENEYWEWYNDLEASVLSFMYRPADYSDDGGHYDYRYRGC